MSLLQKISFDPSSSYLMKNLKPFSTYIFQLAARSKHGLGAFTGEITVQTPQTRMYCSEQLTDSIWWVLNAVCSLNKPMKAWKFMLTWGDLFRFLCQPAFILDR